MQVLTLGDEGGRGLAPRLPPLSVTLLGSLNAALASPQVLQTEQVYIHSLAT